jgi:hypothetical protein
LFFSLFFTEKPHGNRGRKLQRVKNNKKESLEESLDLEASEEASDSFSAKKAEKPAPTPPASLSSSKAGTAPAATGPAPATASEPVTDEEQPVGSLRKKVSKRTASVAALAAISDSTVKEAIEDEELFKPLSPIRVTSEAKSRETGSTPTGSTPTGSSSSPLTANKKDKAVAIVRPQPQQVISGVSNKNNNNLLVQQPVHRESIDREARFSLYDFPSDSEGEDGRPSSSASSPSKQLSQGMYYSILDFLFLARCLLPPYFY